MIMDKDLVLFDAQSLAGVGIGTAYSPDIIDLGPGGVCSSDLELLVKVLTTFTGAGMSMSFGLSCDNDEAFGSAKVLLATPAIPVGDLVEGYAPLKVKLPANCERYVRMHLEVAGAAVTTGVLDAALVLDRQTNSANIGN